MTVYEQTAAAAAEICERAHLQPGSILVVGCSTSEVVGSKIGTNSSVETAGEIARALLDVTGGSLATQVYAALKEPVALEEIKADAGLDIGLTLIGMHLKKVAVPVRLENHTIGAAMVVAARTRPKFIGGARAMYDETML